MFQVLGHRWHLSNRVRNGAEIKVKLNFIGNNR